MRPQEIADKTVIVAPLDWGLGHATRCIPIISILLKQNCQVIFAGNDLQLKLIQKDFPDLICEKIPGYDVSLDSQSSTYRQILAQFNGIKKMAKQEHLIANNLVDKYSADIVVSDNRYGFYADQAFNIFITHQLNPPIPIFRKRVKRMIASFVNLFDCCWIPDHPNHPVCGSLIENNLNVPVFLIGFLSRFKIQDIEEQIDILVIVSGPEPERSKFQNDIYTYLKKKEWSFKIVTPNTVVNGSFVINPSTKELEKLINQSSLIISKSGYTTIMELLNLQKSAILIPTKGQYEQEYLAENIKIPGVKFMNQGQIEDFLNKSSRLKNFV